MTHKFSEYKQGQAIHLFAKDKWRKAEVSNIALNEDTDDYQLVATKVDGLPNTITIANAKKVMPYQEGREPPPYQG